MVDHWYTHVTAAMAAGDAAKAVKAARSFLKPLRDRKEARTPVLPLQVDAAQGEPVTWQEWLGPAAPGEQKRMLAKSKRPDKGLKRWPLDWLDGPGVVCYERAVGRVRKERPASGGVPDEPFAKGLVRKDELPTAVANAADHYIVLEPGKPARFMRTSEVARGFMLPESSTLTPVLLGQTAIDGGGRKRLSANQAVSCLGRSVHVGVARQLVKGLVAHGLLKRGATYGSAFSGVDARHKQWLDSEQHQGCLLVSQAYVVC